MRGRIEIEREGELMISCELQDIEEIMGSAGILLTGAAYDVAQDYLQDHCSCDTYVWLLGYKQLKEREGK